MSGTLQIRDVPDEVRAVVRARAAQAGTSVSDYLLEIISEIASHPTMAEVMERAQAAAASGGATFEDVMEVIREGRDR